MEEFYRNEEKSAQERAIKIIRTHGLDIKSINQYSLAELNGALRRLDKEIESEDFSSAPKTRSRLLERKGLILARIQYLSGQEGIRSLQDMVDSLASPGDRERLSGELHTLQTTANSLEKQSQEAEAERQAAQREDSILKQDLMERRWAVWSKLLARESVATLVGSLLLIALATTLVVAMFLNIEPSSIISNSFLIILGYFFGQNMERRNNRE